MIVALRRVTAAPGWLLALWLVQVAAAAVIGWSLTAAIEQSIAPHAILDDTRRLFALLDVLTDHRGPVAGWATATVATAVGGAIAWTLVVGAVISRLAGHTDPATIAVRWWTSVLPVLAQSTYHLVLRALVVFAVLSTATAAPRFVAWPLLLLAWTTCTVALDLTRTQVVLGDAPRWHPRTAVLALVTTVRSPRRFGPAVALALLQLGLLVAGPWLAVANLGHWVVPVITRGLALLAVMVGLVRIAAVIVAHETDGTAGAASDTPAPQPN